MLKTCNYVSHCLPSNSDLRKIITYQPTNTCLLYIQILSGNIGHLNTKFKILIEILIMQFNINIQNVQNTLT
jgi:hypothetical protein